MTARKRTPLHDFWYPRIDGQILHTMNCHPGWFVWSNKKQKLTIINSLSKRIVGEIVAASMRGNNLHVNAVMCEHEEKESDVVIGLHSIRRGMLDLCPPLQNDNESIALKALCDILYAAENVYTERKEYREIAETALLEMGYAFDKKRGWPLSHSLTQTPASLGASEASARIKRLWLCIRSCAEKLIPP